MGARVIAARIGRLRQPFRRPQRMRHEGGPVRFRICLLARVLFLDPWVWQLLCTQIQTLCGMLLFAHASLFPPPRSVLHHPKNAIVR